MRHLGLLQRFPSKIMDERIGFRSSWKQQGHPTNPTKTKNPIIVLFGREGTKHSTRTERPVDGPKSIQSCVSMPVRIVDKDEDVDQTRTERPVGGQQSTQREEVDIDFRVPGLSCAVVKQAENFRVRELVKKIESHPHRQALQADLQQSIVYNPPSNNSMDMIRELGNVELSELCESVPKVQCSQCLFCWNQGIVYCTCGQFLVESAWKRCCKRVDSQGEHFKGIHDRFLRDQVYRESHLAIGWTEQKCIEMDELAKQNHTYHLSTEEFKRYQGQWYLTLNKSGKNAPVRLRPNFRAAVSLKKPSSS